MSAGEAQAGDWVELKMLMVLGFRRSLSEAQERTGAGRGIPGENRGPDQRQEPEANNNWGKAHSLGCFNLGQEDEQER